MLTIRRRLFLSSISFPFCSLIVAHKWSKQVARGLVLPFTTLLTYFTLSSVPSRKVLIGIGVVCLGFFVGVANEDLQVSAVGIILGVCSSMTTAGHAIVVKRSLPVVKGSAMDLAYYSNLLSSGVMIPAVVIAESGAVVEMFMIGGQGLRTFVVGGLVTVSVCTL